METKKKEMCEYMVGNGWHQVDRSANTFRFKKGTWIVSLCLEPENWKVEFNDNVIRFPLDDYGSIPSWINSKSRMNSNRRRPTNDHETAGAMLRPATGTDQEFDERMDHLLRDSRATAPTRAGSTNGAANLITECIQGLASRVAFLESNHF